MTEFIPIEIWELYIIPHCCLSMRYVNKLCHRLSLTRFFNIIKRLNYNMYSLLPTLNKQDVHAVCKYVSYHHRHCELIELLCKQEKCVHTMLKVCCKRHNLDLASFILKNSTHIQLDITSMLLYSIKEGRIKFVKLLTSNGNFKYNTAIKPKIHKMFDSILRKYYISNYDKINIMLSCILSGILDMSNISLNGIHWLIKHIHKEIDGLKVEKKQKERYYGSFSLNDESIREMKQYLNTVINLLPVDSDVDYNSSSSEDMECSDN